MITNKQFQYLKEYKDYMNEKVIEDDIISHHKTFLKDVKDYKKTLNEIKMDIERLKEIITNNPLKLKKIEEYNNHVYFNVIYPKNAIYIFNGFIELLLDTEENEELYRKYFSQIYPDGEEIKIETEIDIDKNLFNRIHVPVGLPKIIQGIGIGKRIYLEVIKKLKYISTLKYDRTMDSIFIWDSLRKDESVYSFINEEKMICFDINCPPNYIIDMLLDFFKDTVDKKTTILDTTFKNKYFDLIIDSDLKKLI